MGFSFADRVALWILLINTVIALIYMAVMGVWKRQTYIFFRGFVILLCPVTAIVFYMVSFMLEVFFPSEGVDYEQLSMSKERQKFLETINKERELDVIPLEEALAASAAGDRRRVTLNVLKSGVNANLALVRRAVENEDVETSHYAAASLTDALGRYNLEMNDMQALYDRDRTDLENNVDFLNVVLSILNSGGMQGAQQAEYDYKFIHLLENLEQYHPDAVSEEYDAMMVKALCRVGRVQDAEEWAERALKRRPDAEQSYLNVMYTKYVLGKQEEFTQALEKLSHSDIALSRKGLDIVRFWLSQ